jgi:DNA-nicking Smr family endonuclease
MGRRKKKRRSSSSGESNKGKPGVFNPALSSHLTLKAERKADWDKCEPQSDVPSRKDPAENDVFLEAMSDVTPLKSLKNKVIRPPNMGMRPGHPVQDEELEVMTSLAELVSGAGEMDIVYSDEYIEGSVKGFSRKLMRRLKKGEFPIQDYIDLHGLTKKEAEVKVRDFLTQSAAMGLRCVLIVHGRGRNSENQMPILKEQLPVWLSRGPVRKVVLAFSTARPYDGGTGALYILIKRRRR